MKPDEANSLERFRPLLEQAGFCLWQDEPHRPRNEVVDWSARYDEELLELIKLVVKDCAQTAGVSGNVQGHYYTGRQDAQQLILEKWNF